MRLPRSVKGSLSEILARLVLAISPDRTPDEVVQKAKALFLDWLGCAIAGTMIEEGRAFLHLASNRADSDKATVLGLSEKRDPEIAALVNGALAHATEMDDSDRVSVIHPGAAVIPAALAVAEERSLPGLDFLMAIIAGYEIAIRIGEAVGLSHYQIWHSTGTCGTFGAATAAGKLLGLSQEQMVWALGNAGTQAAGLWQFHTEGSMSKPLHAGKAAADGMLAANLALLGLQGPKKILEGDKGFFQAMSRDSRGAAAIADLDPLPSEYKMMRVSIKPYPCCRHTHAAIDAAISIRRKSPILVEKVDRVRVETYGTALDLTDNPFPATPNRARFSLQYCVACALLKGSVTLSDFRPEIVAVESAKQKQLLSKVQVVLSPEIESAYPEKWGARVTLFMRDGTALSDMVAQPTGDPERPMSQRELLTKFEQLIHETKYCGHRALLTSTIGRLETVTSMSQFFPELRMSRN
ncbi:MAG TPA: MmgE/PrpD family protein [Anaerolineae bacterium]|nr:MmgE/PrpD family protein [Anaerolineae bacterium]